MNSDDLLRMIDIIHRDKDIPTEVLFLALDLSGDPGWEYPDGSPVLRAAHGIRHFL